MAIDSNSNDWRVIAEQASRETNSDKLLALAQKLNTMLEAEGTQKQGRKPQKTKDVFPST